MNRRTLLKALAVVVPAGWLARFAPPPPKVFYVAHKPALVGDLMAYTFGTASRQEMDAFLEGSEGWYENEPLGCIKP